MYQNSNRELIKEIARDNYGNHRTRNYTAIFAIFLTTLLITAVCSVGAGLLSTARNAGEQTPGPMADGSITGGQEHLARVLERPEIEWANLVQECSSAPLHNSEFGGVDTRLFAPDAGFYRDNLVELKDGKYPEEADEILVSDTLIKNLGLDETVGQSFTLEVVILEDGEEKEVAIPLTVCGIYNNPLFSISSIYEEIYASQSFREVYNPQLADDSDMIYVKFNNLNPFLFHTDIDAKLSELKDAVGAKSFSSGKNSATMASAFITMLPALLLVFLLMASGYFLIYNVFYISIASDIRWFGMMKTIGGTRAQLKKIMARQVWRMAAVGIGLGILAGYLIGIVAARRIIGMTDWEVYYKNPAFLPAAVMSAVFAAITVKISASRPLRTAAGISPVEAARFTPKKKSGILTVISLALSGIVFLAVSNAVIGYQVQVFVERYNQEDYQIFHKSSLWVIDESYQPVSKELSEGLKALPFVEKVDTIYMARTSNTKDEWNYYEDSTGEIAPTGKLWEYVRYLADIDEASGYVGNRIPWMNDRGNLKLAIFGLPPERWSTEQVNYRITEGEYDQEKFATGQYVIYNKYMMEWFAYWCGKEPDAEKDVHAGDVLDLSFYDSDAGVFRPYRLTVMMVIDSAHEYTSSDIASAVFVLPDTLFRQIYSGYEDMTASLQVRAREELNEEQVKEIQSLIHQEHSTQLQTSSRFDCWQEGYRNRTTYGLIGFFLAGILAVIGISNVVNTVTADVFAHKMEYAVMQSIGMTSRQLFYLLFGKAMKLCLIALLAAVPAGAALGSYIAGDSLFTGFNAPLFAEMALVLVIAVAGLVTLLSAMLTKNLNRKTVVERLGEKE